MDCLDVCYKKIGQIPVRLNVYYPPNLDSSSAHPGSPHPRLPAVVYFHGGGLTVGNRTSWFPTWLKARIVAAGFLFISADYRLIPSCTVHDIIDDIKDLFLFLSRDDLRFKSDGGRLFGVDPTALAVAGSSAGGMCSYLAAIHASPKPKAVLSLYGMGGQSFTPHCLTPKNEVFFLGRELLDPELFAEFFHPRCASLDPITDSELAYHPPDSPTPGWPANPRMPLARLYLQLGVIVDYFTGQHEPSLSVQLRPLLPVSSSPSPASSSSGHSHDSSFSSSSSSSTSADSDYDWDSSFALQNAMKSLIPPAHHAVFPQLNINPHFPPTFLLHGALDSAVFPIESQNMHALLQRAGVPVKLLVIEGASHSLDYVPNAEELYGTHFDEMAEFLMKKLRA